MNNLIYLDNGATSFPKPEVVYTTMDTFYRQYGVNPGRSGFDLCLEAGAQVDRTRKLLRDFFGGTDPNRLVFSYNSTDALNLAIFGLVRPGDHVVTTHLEHNATLRPLWMLEHEAGVKVNWVDFDAQGWVDPQAIIDRITPATRAVVMNHGSNVIGTVQDVAPIGRVCRERGVHLILDASQTAGVVPVDLDTLGADVICFTGHKSLMGPMGIGGMYVREGVEIRHTRAGGTGVKSAQRHHLDEYPYRMEYGTPNLPGIAGLFAGVSWVLEQGMDNLHRHEMRLWTRLRDGLRDIPGAILYCADDVPGKGRISVLSFNIEGLEAADTGTMLDVDHNIACRTGLHCTPMVHEHLGTDRIHGAVRFGIGPFNTEAHIDAAIAAVAEIASLRARRA
ncbi:MAG TPA: aminotransferase class V-fold PLP-dependent enzyme [Thermoanaerobaculaceae bacterium]|nr:aminotransferase class V-fold PLP-dependent enzyme [Thermoanaerobaculaceae bacterium]HRS15195.1 aminotransferase class V-fold PLP-dependent enzyme [Thermoanaerobaculaceae bacterium]